MNSLVNSPIPQTITTTTYNRCIMINRITQSLRANPERVSKAISYNYFSDVSLKDLFFVVTFLFSLSIFGFSVSAFLFAAILNNFVFKNFIEKVSAQKNSNEKVFAQKGLSEKVFPEKNLNKRVFEENDLNKTFCAKNYESCFGRSENKKDVTLKKGIEVLKNRDCPYFLTNAKLLFERTS